MTRIGVGGLINLDRIHQASLLLNDIRLFHQHAAAAAAASSADCGSNRRSSVDDPCSQDVTPETASEQSAPRLLSDASGRRSMRSRVCMTVRLGCPSVCLSVCPVDREHQRRAAGLLLSAGACSRYRPIALTRRTRSAVNAGSVMLRAEGRGSTQICLGRIRRTLCVGTRFTTDEGSRV